MYNKLEICVTEWWRFRV